MDTPQFSTRQLSIIAAVIVGTTLAVFSLGLMTAGAFSEQAQAVEIQPIEPRPESALAAAACIELPAPAQTTATQAPPGPPTEAGRYGIQAGVFAELDNAVEFAARHADPEFPARIFRRVDGDNKALYPVLVGLYPTMDEAQQAKHAFIKKSALDSFVTDASQLSEEIVPTRTLAMLH